MHFSSFVLAAIPLAVFPLLVSSTASRACYFLDGTLITNDSPCFSDKSDSMCCGRGHSCMSNGLCRWPNSAMPAPLQYIRGSCTDKTWNSTACPQYCENQYKSSFDGVIGCPSDQYCCEQDPRDPGSCCTKSPLFQVPAATTITVIGANSWVSTTVGIPTGVKPDNAASTGLSSPLSDPVGFTSTPKPSSVTVSLTSTIIAASSAATPTTTVVLSSHGTDPLQTTGAASSSPAVQTKSSGASAKRVAGLCAALMVIINLCYLLL